MMNPDWAIGAGERLPLGTAVLGRDDIIAFASEFDAQVFHLDDNAAETTLLGGLAASGWHTCIAVMGLLQRTLDERALILDSIGADEIIWLKPVRPGDTLTAMLTWGARSCGTCGERSGAFPVTVETINQNGDPVMRWGMDCLVRPATGGSCEPPRPADCPMRLPRPARVKRKGLDCGIKFFEDVQPGDEIDLGVYRFTAEAIRDFRSRYDSAPQADRAALALAASPWHLTAAWMQCIVGYYERHAQALQARRMPVPTLGPAAGLKHLRWHRPVRAGEMISYRAWAERKIEIASHRDWGLLVVGAQGVNEIGEAVVTFYPQMLLERASRLEPALGTQAGRRG